MLGLIAGLSFASRPSVRQATSAALAPLAPASEASAWTVVALPDTQNYVAYPANNAQLFGQTRWIARNAQGQDDGPEARNIAFVTQLGDVVNDGGSIEQWTIADAAFSRLDGPADAFPQALVPYSIGLGNHDFQLINAPAAGASSYLRYFGAGRYRQRRDGRSYRWYRGSSPDGLAHYQFFEAGGYRFLHLSLPWEAPGPVSDPATSLGWASRVLAAHPEMPSILSTHAYLWDMPGAEGRTREPQSLGGSSGQRIYEDLVLPHPQVFMVLNGHWHQAEGPDDGEYHQTARNSLGLPVYEMLANYQDWPSGGEGWMRLIDFLPGAGARGADRIAVSTFSPTRNAGAGDLQTDARSSFHFDLDFEARFRGALSGREALARGRRDVGRAPAEPAGLVASFEAEPPGGLIALPGPGRLGWEAAYLAEPRPSAWLGINELFFDPARPANRHQLVQRGAPMRWTSERVDVGAWDEPGVALDLRSYEDSSLTDFEAEDHLRVLLRYSRDGLAFDERILFEARGDIDDPSRDALKRLDAGRDGPFVTVVSPPGFIPPGTRAIEIVIEAVNDSDSERFFYDNLRVFDGPLPRASGRPSASATPAATDIPRPTAGPVTPVTPPAAPTPAPEMTPSSMPPTITPPYDPGTTLTPTPGLTPAPWHAVYLPWLKRG